jgi:tetratricopeptide (TPR) repeat protein
MSQMLTSLFDPLLSTPQQMREINHHYQVSVIASDTHDIARCQAGILRMQASHAQALQAGFSDLTQGQSVTNELLGDIRLDLGQLQDGMSDVLCEITNLNETLQSGLSHISQQLQDIRIELNSIQDTLAHPYETEALELREKAFRWLSIGLGRSGPTRFADLTDATRLYDLVLENPIGMQDYSAWFQRGYLYWKHDRDIKAARQAFERAARLSSVDNDAYWVQSIRHLAEMHYLSGDYREAYITLSGVTGKLCDHMVMYDQARYSARLDQSEEAIHLLRKCISENPLAYIAMQAEEDFMR